MKHLYFISLGLLAVVVAQLQAEGGPLKPSQLEPHSKASAYSSLASSPSARRSPQAWLSASQNKFIFVINRTKKEDLGSWILFLDCGFGNGLKDELGGLANIDLKLEDGRVFRFAPNEQAPWRNEGSFFTKVSGDQFIIEFPFPKSIAPSTIIKWRCALFPHNSSKPILLPSELGSLAATQRVPLQHKSNSILPLQRAFSMVSTDLKLPWKTIGSVSHWPRLKVTTTPVTRLQSPFEQALWWPDHQGSLNDILNQESQAASLLHTKKYPIIFSSIEHKNLNLVNWINRVRSWACRDVDHPFALSLNDIQEIPKEPTIVILPWEGAVEDIIKNLQQRSIPPLGFRYVRVQSFLDMNASEQALSWEAWMTFNIIPLLPPERSLRTFGHDVISSLVWFRLLQQKEIAWAPVPAQMNLAHYKSWLRLDPQSYLTRLEQDLQELLPQTL